MQKAEDARRRSTSLDPLSATEWNNFAYTCEYNGDAACHLEAAQRAHELAPQDTGAIRGLVRALNANHRGEETAQVTSAHPLDADQLASLKTRLRGRIGRDVAIETKFDPAILGGLIVQIGSQMIDGSIRTKLNTLAHAMKG